MELLYGRHAVVESLRAGRRKFRRVVFGQGVQRAGIIDEIAELAMRSGCAVGEGPRKFFDGLGDVNHQGVVAETSDYPYAELDELLEHRSSEQPFILVLDHLQDVQNLGTLLRTAEAMGVSGVVVPGRRAAGITPAVVNASSGAVEHLRVAMVVNLAQTLTELKRQGLWVVGLEAVEGSVPLGEADLSGPLALIVGSEGSGLARLVRERCDWLVSIPMYGRIGSLNAAVAGSIALVAARQARGTA